MFTCENGIMKLTRGDTASILVSVRRSDGEPFEYKFGDVIELIVNDVISDEWSVGDYILYKVRPIRSDELSSGIVKFEIKLTHDETVNLEPGKYSAMIRYTRPKMVINGVPQSDEDTFVHTIWPTNDIQSIPDHATDNWENFIVLPWRRHTE